MSKSTVAPRLTPVEPGDLCCSCGLPADGKVGHFSARRIDGHPFCGRAGKCYDAQWAQYGRRRDECRCRL